MKISLLENANQNNSEVTKNETTVNKETKTEGKLWGGRFKKESSAELNAISASTSFDFILAEYDIKCSIAHSHALENSGIITKEECEQIENAYNEMLNDLENGELKPKASDEDVHGCLERVLIEKIGAEIGGKIRAGRSRNDQIATLIRMYIIDQGVEIANLLISLIKELFNKSIWAMTASAQKEGDPLIMPGRTHMQHAQPVLLSHHLLAHAWRLLRDLERLGDCFLRIDSSPYGSGALAGSTLGLDQELVADELDFSSVTPNSIDATASRDAVAEFLFCLSLLSVNLSSISEEFIIWNTKEFDYLTLDDAYSTGSSIMPQKKNPDIAELTRGKSGRVIGSLVGILTTLKGLPLAYNRDLQEDKEGLFDAVEQMKLILPAFSGMVKTAVFNAKGLEELAPAGFSLATDIAEFLVKQKIPFKVAHELAGAATKRAENQKVELHELSVLDYSEIFGNKIRPELIETMLKHLNIFGSVKMRSNISGTAPKSVVKQMQLFEESFNEQTERFA